MKLMLCVVLFVWGDVASAASEPVEGPLKAAGVEKAGPYAMRGFGEVSAEARSWETQAGRVSLVTFVAEDEERALIVASKYIADLAHYSAGRELSGKFLWRGWTYAVEGAGTWVVALDGKKVHVLNGPGQAALAEAVASLGAEHWKVPSLEAHPKYLDNFDNRALSIWWRGRGADKEVQAWAAEQEAIINAVPGGVELGYAPGVVNLAPYENVFAQGQEIDRPHRVMLYAVFPPSWWASSVDMREHFESASPGTMPGHTINFAGLYQAAQTSSREANAVMAEVMYKQMDLMGKDMTMAWKIPPGEWNIKPWDPPGAPEGYRQYLREVKGYSLEEANAAHGARAESWEDFPYPDESYFFGRRGEVIDLDGEWKWRSRVTMDEGLKAGMENPSFDDREWMPAPRDSLRLNSIFDYPLWGRTSVEVPETFLKSDQRTYLYTMPQTRNTNAPHAAPGDGREIRVWVNGEAFEGKQLNGLQRGGENRCTWFDVTDALRVGKNEIAVYSHGGRIRNQVWLTHTPPDEYPYADRTVTRRWLDWLSYLLKAKLDTVEFWFRAIRAVDQERPIKLMTGWQFTSDALDLLERYGGYQHLTGEGSHFQPAEPKGYARLRGLPGSSEGGNPPGNETGLQRLFGLIFWQGQDAHDYVFDIQKDVYAHEWGRKWMEENALLLSSLGNTDFPLDIDMALLRDYDQTWLYGQDSLAPWDLSSGILPALGVVPAFLYGGDMDRGLARNIPVLFDISTSVMTEKRVGAILDYVEHGGTFVAMFNTGRHSEYEKDVWPLARKLGLRVVDKSIDPDNPTQSRVLPMTFLRDQSLLPSLQGKTIDGLGISIDHLGKTHTGAVGITPKDGVSVKPIALWDDDGTMAACEIKLGKGRIVWLGSPFFQRAKHADGGVWLNDSEKQAILAEMLEGLGVELEVSKDDDRLWVSRRVSKNGLYDVFFAAPMGGYGSSGWKIDEKMRASVILHHAPEGCDTAYEMTQQGRPAVEGVRRNGDLVFKDLEFRPMLVRQLAMVRDDVGVRGPLHWLRVQSRTWRALDLPEGIGDMRAEITAEVREVAQRLGQDGLSLTDGWKVRKIRGEIPAGGWTEPAFDDADWESGSLGLWRVHGWKGLNAAQYRRTVQVPKDWLGPRRRIFLFFRDESVVATKTGVRDRGRLWLDGRLLTDQFEEPSWFDITKEATAGPLHLALEVEGDSFDGGPGGAFYLWSVPKPAKTLDLDGAWRVVTDWDREKGAVNIPGKIGSELEAIGIRREFELPPGWEGKTVRLVLEGDGITGECGVVINQHHYFRDTKAVFAPYGVRVDHWLEPGTNSIDIYSPKHRSRSPGTFDGNLSVRLELYENTDE